MVLYPKYTPGNSDAYFFELEISKADYSQKLVIFKEEIKDMESLEKMFKGSLFFSEGSNDNCARLSTLPYNYINIRKTPYYKELKRHKKQILESIMQQKNVALIKWSL